MAYSQRVESQLPTTFYSTIDAVPNDLWMKFVRYLGLDEGDINNVSGRDRGLQEKKYQILNRWKMYLGVVPDAAISEILKRTTDEIYTGASYDCNVYPDSMKKNIKRAKIIYQVIEQYDRESWLRIARMKLTLRENDLIRIRNAYEDETERRYQMVLTWIRAQQLDNTVVDERLLQLRDQPLS